MDAALFCILNHVDVSRYANFWVVVLRWCKMLKLIKFIKTKWQYVMVKRVWSQNTKRKIKGVTLIDALEKIILQPKRPPDKLFHISVCDVDKRKGVATCRIEQRKIAPGVDVRSYLFGVMCWKVCGDNIDVDVKRSTKDNIWNNVVCNEKYVENDAFTSTSNVTSDINNWWNWRRIV